MARSAIAARFGEVGEQALADGAEVSRRLARLGEGHVRPLNELYAGLEERGPCPCAIPRADPAGAGVRARVVLLVKSCGRGAMETGLTSIDTPDQSARNLRGLLGESPIGAGEVCLVNALAWPPVDGRGRMRRATAEEREIACEVLPRLLGLFGGDRGGEGGCDGRRVVLTMGEEARRLLRRSGAASGGRFRLVHAPNPSPRVVKVTGAGLNRHGRRILEALAESAG